MPRLTNHFLFYAMPDKKLILIGKLIWMVIGQ